MPHLKGHIRDALLDWLDGFLASDGPVTVSDLVQVGGNEVPLQALLGELWNCTDVLPGDRCRDLELPQGSTYAVAVRRLKADLK